MKHLSNDYIFDGVTFPNTVYDALSNGTCVVFAGAGVSMGGSSNYPDFSKLMRDIAGERIPKSAITDPPKYLGELADRGVKVHELTSDILSKPESTPNPIHYSIINLFKHHDVKIVTTNFDQHFTTAAQKNCNDATKIYNAPALPVGSNISGIIHLHGSTAGDSNQLILTDRDFGRAYLTEGWAARFLLDLYNRYTILFIGYSHNDAIVSYLARGYGNDTKELYALSLDDGTEDKWRKLGIEPILYPLSKTDKHIHLSRSIQKLSHDLGLGVLEKAQRVRDMASTFPPKVDSEESHFLFKAIAHPVISRYFYASAQGEEWGKWSTHTRLSHLLLTARMDAEPWARTLTSWYCKEIALKYPDIAIENLSDLKENPGKLFLCEMWQSLDYDSESISPNIIGRWTIILVSQYGSAERIHEYSKCLKNIVNKGQRQAAMVLYNELIKPKLSLEKTFIPHSDSGNAFFNEFRILGDEHTLTEFHNEVICKDIENWAGHLLLAIPNHLTAIDRADRAFRNENRPHYGWSMHRSSITEDEQDQYRNGSDVLIDGLREACLWVATHQPQQALFLAASWSKSEVTLLQRFSIYITTHCVNVTADEKVSSIYKESLLGNISAHNDIFLLIKEHINACSESAAKALLNYIKNHYKDTATSDDDCAYRYFNALTWIKKHTTIHAKTINKRLGQIKRKHQNFGERERPDLLSYSSSSGWRGETVTNPDEIHTLTPSQICASMMDLESKSDYWGDGPGPTLKAYTAAYPIKSISLLSRFARYKKYPEKTTSDCCATILTELVNHFSTHQVWDTLYRVLQSKSVYENIPHAICEFLSSLIYANDDGVWKNKRSQLLTIAFLSAKSLKNNPIQTQSNHSHYEAAKLSSVGRIIGSTMTLLYPHTKNGRLHIRQPFKIFNFLLTRGDDVGQSSRIVLLSYCARLYQLKPEWTKKKLLVLLNRDIQKNPMPYWHGFLHDREKNIHLMGEVSGYMLDLSTLLLKDDHIQKYLTFIIASYCVHFPRKKHQSKLCHQHVSFPSAKVRSTLYYRIHRFITDEEIKGDRLWKRWLKEHLKNRLYGRPLPLAAEETAVIIQIVVSLDVFYTEAISLILQAAPPESQHSNFLGDIFKSAPWKKRPTETCRLINWAYKSNTSTIYVTQSNKSDLSQLIDNTSDLNIVKSMLNTLAMCGYYDALAMLDKLNLK